VDSAERPDDAQLRRTWERSTGISPLFGGEGSGGLCRFWPVAGSDQARHVNAAGSGPILVVGGKGDPATPYQWAPRLTKELGTARLLTYEGEGHGAYTSGNRCIQRRIDAYLLNGKLTARGAVCEAT
jgi:pimeloyl-ACP methyl ester carboxylesterase